MIEVSIVRRIGRIGLIGNTLNPRYPMLYRYGIMLKFMISSRVKHIYWPILQHLAN